jgi:hypothetical protein
VHSDGTIQRLACRRISSQLVAIRCRAHTERHWRQRTHRQESRDLVCCGSPRRVADPSASLVPALPAQTDHWRHWRRLRTQEAKLRGHPAQGWQSRASTLMEWSLCAVRVSEILAAAGAHARTASLSDAGSSSSIGRICPLRPSMR